ncbi:methyl-CpG-binding domain protein 1 isoform X11 [Perognathus longimembris pacificus]|uniref:methyl-CpG-binding domain protein 1 isoform X11 n=1 Tax=Perognathus longimembris pacificus TaxID=214514 RepID=UPI002019ADCE|nr:methyl-CpG-binding domain protein 1 isoform X11 [Perognathus longimembris pacificus]
MAEDWLDCPALGPGWKRREVYRKSGVTCGRSDIYYQSPTGDRIRSKVELTRYLGPACDLTLFNFKQGILCYPAAKAHSVAVPSKKQKKPSKPAAKARNHQVGPKKGETKKETPKNETKADTGTAQASFPAPGCCENCGISFSRDGTKRQWLKTLCKDCRAQRIAFNREQRKYKRVGCGECAACLVKEDCGACSTCLQQLPNDAAPRPFIKCEQRRCLRIVEKSPGCGVCRGCQTQEDCGRCRICLRPPRPGVRRQWRCVQRRCLRHLTHRLHHCKQGCQRCPPLVVVPPAGKKRSHRKGGCNSKKAPRRRAQAQPPPPLPAAQSPKHRELHTSAPEPSSPAEFIYYCVDEDELKRLLPSIGPGSKEVAESPPLCRRRKRPSSAKLHRPGPTRNLSRTKRASRPGLAQSPPKKDKKEAGGGFVLPPPGTDLVFLREGASSPVQVPGPAVASTEAPLQEAECSRLSWVVALPQVKQEKPDTEEEWTPGTGTLTSPTMQPGCLNKAVDTALLSVKQEPPDPEEEKEENKDNCVSQSAPEEETGGAGTPVITEIFSLGGTRFRDTAVWLPRSKKLKNPGARKQ